MYDIINQIIAHTYVSGDSMQQYIIYTCCALIIVLTAVLIDMVVRILFRFSGIK